MRHLPAQPFRQAWSVLRVGCKRHEPACQLFRRLAPQLAHTADYEGAGEPALLCVPVTPNSHWLALDDLMPNPTNTPPPPQPPPHPPPTPHPHTLAIYVVAVISPPSASPPELWLHDVVPSPLENAALEQRAAVRRSCLRQGWRHCGRWRDRLLDGWAGTGLQGARQSWTRVLLRPPDT